MVRNADDNGDDDIIEIGITGQCQLNISYAKRSAIGAVLLFCFRFCSFHDDDHHPLPSLPSPSSSFLRLPSVLI